MKDEKNREFDEELVGLFEESMENAYMSIVMQHPEEDFYICMFHFDQKLHARVSAFSTQAFEWAMQEQEITDETEKRWYRVGGVVSLCQAYGYTERLSELDDVLDRRAAVMIGDPWEMLQKLADSSGNVKLTDYGMEEVIKCEKEFNIRTNSAARAVARLREKGMFGSHSQFISVRVGPESLNSVFRDCYIKNRDEADFLVMLVCDSDSRSPLMPEWMDEL